MYAFKKFYFDSFSCSFSLVLTMVFLICDHHYTLCFATIVLEWTGTDTYELPATSGMKASSEAYSTVKV